MAEDPTMVSTLVNMVMQGCQMHAGVFATMGKGEPLFLVQGNYLLVAVSDGTYKIEVVYFSTATNAPAAEQMPTAEQKAEDAVAKP